MRCYKGNAKCLYAQIYAKTRDVCAFGLPFEQCWKSLATVWIMHECFIILVEWRRLLMKFLNKVETWKLVSSGLSGKQEILDPLGLVPTVSTYVGHFLSLSFKHGGFIKLDNKSASTEMSQQLVSPWFAFSNYIRDELKTCDSFNSVDLGPFRDVSSSSCPACCPRRCIPRKEPLFKFAYLA